MTAQSTLRRLALAVTFLAVATLLPPLRAAEPPVASARSFEEAWKELEAAKAAPTPAGAPMKEMALAMGQRAQRTSRLALDIFEGFPTDPRRWQAAIEIIGTTHGYVYDIVGDPKVDGPNAFRRDNAARAAWGAYARALYEQILAAPGLSDETVKAAIEAFIYRLNMTPGSTMEEQRATIDEFARRFPQDPKLVSYEDRYYMRLQQHDPAAAVVFLQRLSQSDNPALRQMAEAKSRLAVGKALDLKFTAVDGREVDAAQLRGKVVLVDFWATWCGPCIEELPNVRRVYDAYHDKGFEVIAISLDSDRKKLLDFVREKKLPWPQHFDGKAWKNEFAQKYHVTGIPAMLLVDRDGKIVTSNARGPKLEAEVKRLLGL